MPGVSTSGLRLRVCVRGTRSAFTCGFCWTARCVRGRFALGSTNTLSRIRTLTAPCSTPCRSTTSPIRSSSTATIQSRSGWGCSMALALSCPDPILNLAGWQRARSRTQGPTGPDPRRTRARRCETWRQGRHGPRTIRRRHTQQRVCANTGLRTRRPSLRHHSRGPTHRRPGRKRLSESIRCARPTD